jgi:trimethylamine--corrinoid protein Co-methyltransferase
LLHRFLGGLDVNEDTLALDLIAEVGPGGHHLGTAHTLERFRDAFYRPMLADRLSYETWREAGAWDAARRANMVAKQLLAEYEEPEMDTAVRTELEAYVTRRKQET